MKQKIIGIYDLGFEQAQLVLREDIGGEFYCIPEKGSIARIKIGADQQHWDQVMAVLLHETFELLVMRAAGRWSPCSHLSRDHAAYLFSFNHTQFSDICAKQGEFLAAALPDLAREWKAWKKGRGKKPA